MDGDNSSDQAALDDGNDILAKIYTNFHSKIEAYHEKQFAEEIDKTEFKEADELRDIMNAIVSEDIRVLAILACSYTDDRLEKMFKAFVPTTIPGGASSLFGPFGPLATFANRIKLAAAFQLLTEYLIEGMNSLRKVRNDLAHNWNSRALSETEEIIKSLDKLPVDIHMLQEEVFISKFPQFKELPNLKSDEIFRIRLMFYIINVFYETSYYAMAKKRRLIPEKALFGKHHPGRLGEVSRLPIKPATQIIEESKAKQSVVQSKTPSLDSSA